MDHIAPQISILLAATIFVTAILLNFSGKISISVWLYVVQSATIAILLLSSVFDRFSILLLIAVISTILVKVIIAPTFFLSLIKKYHITSTTSTYLNTPLTLLVIAGLLFLTQADFFTPLISLAPQGHNLLFISIATILISLFLSINRKGAVSQMMGILSLENGIVAFALFSGLEQNAGLQLGITLNIFIWIVISTVFASMIYQKFGSLDVSTMKGLTE
ncbi:MAG: hypothetical protein PHQ59_04255 [Candidatus Daviesbacteria bacterium]|nr:hypothetical protein [Candidatus Daviesbacteria bacterium]